MGRDAYEASARARAVFDRAGEIIDFDLAGVCFNGPASELEKTNIQQPAIFVTSIALWELLLERGGRKDWFTRAGGLSLGEYTALHAANAVSFDDALRLVYRRGCLMQQAAECTAGGMVSLIGADETAATNLCEQARQGDVLAPANFNCPGQIVISGSRGACERAVELAGQFDCRAVALPVAGAFHSPLMQPAADGLAPVLAETPFAAPAIPVIANVNAEYHANQESIRDGLRAQVTQPVLWHRCMLRIISEGVDTLVEVGPGRVLTGLMRKIDRKVTAVNVSTVESIDAAIQRLNSA